MLLFSKDKGLIVIDMMKEVIIEYLWKDSGVSAWPRCTLFLASQAVFFFFFVLLPLKGTKREAEKRMTL